MGFSQAYYIIFQSFDSEEDDNPLDTSVESVLKVKFNRRVVIFTKIKHILIRYKKEKSGLKK